MNTKVLLLDIETAPHKVYAWGLFDQNIAINQIEETGYVLCWAAKWLGTKKLISSSLLDGKENMLSSIHKLLDEADVVVHYYGKKFDIPTLNREFVSLGFPPPSPFKELDLIDTAKRKFKFASNKLSFVCETLGLGTKVPHKGMALWLGCMRGDKSSWKAMLEYNKGDVVLLEKLYYAFLPWLVSRPNMAHLEGELDLACSGCSSHNVQKRGYYHTKTMVYQRYQCQDCGTWSRARVADKEKRPVLVPA